MMVFFSTPENPPRKHWARCDSHLEGRKIANSGYLFVVQAHTFEITTVTEIHGVNWRGAAEGTRQLLRTVSKL